MSGNRDDFSTKTKEILAKQVAFRCSNPNCRKLTCGSGTKKDAIVNIGVAAHICAAAPGGKRYDPDMTRSQRKDSDNGIWLCQSCAKLIDSDETEFPVELLHGWKEQARIETVRALEFREGEGMKHVQTLEEFLTTIPECKSLKDYLRCISFLNGEMNRLVEKMEELQRKIDLTRGIPDSTWSAIYERQLENTRSLFMEIDDQVARIRKQAHAVRRDILLGESAVAAAAGATLCSGASLVGAAITAGMAYINTAITGDVIWMSHTSTAAYLMLIGLVSWTLISKGVRKNLQRDSESITHLLVDAWKLADQVESAFAECDEIGQRLEESLRDDSCRDDVRI